MFPGSKNVATGIVPEMTLAKSSEAIGLPATMDLAERLIGLLAQVRRPAEARLDPAHPDRQRADADEVQGQQRQLADLIGCVESLSLDAGP